VGNVPLAAVLWSGGISFAGVLAFLFADLIVLPIMVIYRKYYGTRYAVRIVALMLITMILAALIVDVLFGLAGILPSGPRPTRTAVFGHVAVDYKLVLNVFAAVIFVALFALSARQGATDPECGMKVDRRTALKLRSGGRTLHFCCPSCMEAFTERRAASSPPHGQEHGAHHDLRHRDRGAEGIPGAPAQARADV
jgi:YHS domain-containing protein